MDIQLYLVNAGEDEFTTLAVLRQHLGLTFAEARDLVIDLPSTLPPVAAASVDALQAALAEVGAEISTTKPEPVEEVVTETESFQNDDTADLFDPFFVSEESTSESTEEDEEDDEEYYDDEDEEEEYDDDENDDDDEDDDEEDYDSDIIFTLTNCGNQKLRIVKLIVDALGCGLKKAKEICDDAPIDVTLDGSLIDTVIDLVDNINEIGGEADWDYADDEDDDEGKSDKALFLKSCGNSKLQVVKLLKEFLGLGLAEAKAYADMAPISIRLTEEQAADLDTYLDYLADAGADASAIDA